MGSISDFSNGSNLGLKGSDQLDSKPPPLIFALTGKTMNESEQKILNAQFIRVYEHIRVAECK